MTYGMPQAVFDSLFREVAFELLSANLATWGWFARCQHQWRRDYGQVLGFDVPAVDLILRRGGLKKGRLREVFNALLDYEKGVMSALSRKAL